MYKLKIKNISIWKRLYYTIILNNQHIHMSWEQCDVYKSSHINQDYFFYFNNKLEAIKFKLENL